MARIAKYSVRLIGLGLLIYIIMKIVIAVNKLQDEKVPTATTRKYEHNRLFPSISFCFRKKNRSDYSDNLESALNISRQVQLLDTDYRKDWNHHKIAKFVRQEVLGGLGHKHIPHYEGYSKRNLLSTSQTKKSKHIFVHTHSRFQLRGKQPVHCIGYNPPAPSIPRRKGVSLQTKHF